MILYSVIKTLSLECRRMSVFVVLTAIGPDRAGLVDEISAFLTDRSINIEDSRMAVLGGEFAVILLASGEKEKIASLEKNLPSIQKNTGLNISIKETIAPGQRRVAPSIPHKLHATSMDHPGIVHEITSVLYRYSINIETLDTRVSHGPVSGAPVFNMRCALNIPVDEKLSSIRKELSELGDRLYIDIELLATEGLRDS